MADEAVGGYGVPIGSKVIELDRVDSTSKYAAEAFSAGIAAHGTVIMAHEQTEGRGQRGRTWHSGSGTDLTVSYVLEHPGLKVEQRFDLARWVALAVHDTVQALVPDPDAVRIKWPNDILVGGRKISGILIETDVSGDRVRSSIVGIGLNVNGDHRDPAYRATSLRALRGGELGIHGVLSKLSEGMQQRWLQWQLDPRATASDYGDRLWERGRMVVFLLDGNPLHARPLDVDGEGRLLVETAAGTIAAYGLDRLRVVPG